MRIPRATVDFESRSARSLRTTGAWRYSIDPSTDILCLAFRLAHWEKDRTGLWHPAFPHLGIEEPEDFSDILELVQWVQSGGLLEAHNVWFERCMWGNILAPRFGFPVVPREQWRCSAAKAAAYTLPRGLDDAADALHLKLSKDPAGAKLIQRLSKPRKSRKKERELWAKQGLQPPAVLWHESKDEFERFWAYCQQDVLVEEAVSEALDDLNPLETRIFLMDQKINDRGFQLDRQAVTTALSLIAEENAKLNTELAEVTDGYVAAATKRADMKVWFASEGLDLNDTQGATLDAVLLDSSLSVRARRAVELMRALGRSSTAKYQRMLDWAGADFRIRGGLLYHGASTGRWSGSGVQPHNFPKLSPKPVGQEKDDPEDMNHLWDALTSEERDFIVTHYKGVMEALSAGLRGAIVAPPGRQLYVADFASIEARVLLWLAEDEDGLQLFRNHEDVYCDMASSIYGYPTNKKDHPTERGMGKIAILGLGYQMGPSKFTDTCAKFGITIAADVYCQECGRGTREHGKETHPFVYTDGDEDVTTSVKVVNAYRTKYWRVKQCWYDQEAAAIAAVQTRQPVQCYNVRWVYRAPFLFCELPSGRRLTYPEPRVKETIMPWGASKPVLSYMGVDPRTRQWKRQTVYGGLLVENIVQAESRDLMAEGMLRAEKTGIYELVLSVHDELVAEAEKGQGSVKEFEALMSKCPRWATGCPVEAEGWTGKRYRK